MQTKMLSENDIKQLRAANLISINEIALKEGDLIIALDVTTTARRIVATDGLMLESTKTLLLD